MSKGYMMSELGLKSIGERVRRIVRTSLPKNLYLRCAATLDACYGVKAFGLKEYRKLSAVSREPAGEAPSALHLRPLSHPFYVRPGTPDASLVLHAIAR